MVLEGYAGRCSVDIRCFSWKGLEETFKWRWGERQLPSAKEEDEDPDSAWGALNQNRTGSILI